MGEKRNIGVPMRKAPSLVDLCVETAIDNVRYLGDVGETDLHLLDRILPHCTRDQLMRVETSTKGRDLTSVTDKLWKKFYKKDFGEKSLNLVIERMKEKKVAFRWKQLYEAKVQDMNEAEKKTSDRLKQLYQKEDAPYVKSRSDSDLEPRFQTRTGLGLESYMLSEPVDFELTLITLQLRHLKGRGLILPFILSISRKKREQIKEREWQKENSSTEKENLLKDRVVGRLSYRQTQCTLGTYLCGKGPNSIQQLAFSC